MKIAPETIHDLLGLVGIILLSYGCWTWFQPLGFISGGACLYILAVIGALRERPSERDDMRSGR